MICVYWFIQVLYFALLFFIQVLDCYLSCEVYREDVVLCVRPVLPTHAYECPDVLIANDHYLFFFCHHHLPYVVYFLMVGRYHVRCDEPGVDSSPSVVSRERKIRFVAQLE